jgi:hypothetical protein
MAAMIAAKPLDSLQPALKSTEGRFQTMAAPRQPDGSQP